MQNDIDTAKIKTVIECIGKLADCGEFDTLASRFTPEVHVDYTSAFGGEAEVVTNTELMKRWAGLLPGFDCTRHEISDIAIVLADDKATATAQIVADHWIDGKHWQVSGSYDYKLERSTFKNASAWKVAYMTFNLTGEKGSRDVLGLAATQAQGRADPGY